MSANLSPEERTRIAEEEKVRLQTQVKEGTKFMKWALKWYLIIIAVVIGIFACSCLAYFGVLGSMLS